MIKFHYLISLSGLLLDVLYLPEQFNGSNGSISDTCINEKSRVVQWLQPEHELSCSG